MTKGSRVFSSPPFPSSLSPCYEGRRNSVRNTGVSRHFSHGRLTALGPADRAKGARPSCNTPTRENSRANPDRRRGRPPPRGLKLDESMPFSPKPRVPRVCSILCGLAEAAPRRFHFTHLFFYFTVCSPPFLFFFFLFWQVLPSIFVFSLSSCSLCSLFLSFSFSRQVPIISQP